MPAGNDPLISRTWQPLPGAPGLTIFPLIRKVDIVSSNSYLIQTPEAILLIDPGGVTEQAEEMFRMIVECREENERPVFVILTHAHVDHFAGILNLPAAAHTNVTVFLVQETGARALGAADCGMTQAGILNVPLVPIHVGFPLITGDRKERQDVPAEICFSNGGRITVTGRQFGTGECSLYGETLVFGAGEPVTVYHTPGHSPDSICIRIGSTLFIGDIVFAANPGVAGQIGWSQEDLIRSLGGLEHLLAGGGISLVCPGHGRLIPATDAVRMIAGVRKDALALANIAALDSERAARTAAFAEDCMAQVNELFTIMAGRLYYVSYVLDELGESEIAAEMNTLLSSDTVDELLLAFRTFAEEHHRGENLSIQLALKAGQVIAKLERTFRTDALSGIIDQTLILRAQRLLSDYTTVLRGFSPPREITETDLVLLVHTLIAGLSIDSCSDEEVLSSTDDEQAFARILLARIGTRPLLENIVVELTGQAGPIPVLVDREHLSDLITYILEDLVGTGSDRIGVAIESTDTDARILISGAMTATGEPGHREIDRFLCGLCERAGGSLATGIEKDRTRWFSVSISRVIDYHRRIKRNRDG